MEDLRNYCQDIMEQSDELLDALIIVIRNCIQRIMALFSWPKQAQLQLALIEQPASAPETTLSLPKRSKKGHSRSKSIALRSKIDRNIDEHVEKVESPNEILQDEPKEELTELQRATLIMQGDKNMFQQELKNLQASGDLDAKGIRTKPEPKEELTELQRATLIMRGDKNMFQQELKNLQASGDLDTKGIRTKPEVLTKLLADIKRKQQDASQREAKPLSLPDPQMQLVKYKKPLPRLIKQRTRQPCNIANEQAVAKHQQAVIMKPKWC